MLVVAGDSPAPTRLPPCASFQNQLILGVMGIDVALNDIKRLTPRYNVREVPSPPSLPCAAQAWSGNLLQGAPSCNPQHPIALPAVLVVTGC